MILDLAGDGPLGAAVRSALEKAGVSVRSTSSEDDDLFSKACGCRAIVYAPASDLFQGQVAPAPDVARMRRVLGATNAPGVRALIVVAPQGYDQELDALMREGVPYGVLRAAPLVEDLARVPAVKDAPPVWLPRGGEIRLARASEVAAEVVRAIDSPTGATVDAPSELLDAADAILRAAELSGRRVVRTTPKRVDSVFRGVGKLLGLEPPPIVMLHDQLTQHAALPA